MRSIHVPATVGAYTLISRMFFCNISPMHTCTGSCHVPKCLACFHGFSFLVMRSRTTFQFFVTSHARTRSLGRSK